MILSNPTSGNDLDKTSIITLGDSLGVFIRFVKTKIQLCIL